MYASGIQARRTIPRAIAALAIGGPHERRAMHECGWLLTPSQAPENLLRLDPAGAHRNVVGYIYTLAEHLALVAHIYVSAYKYYECSQKS